VLGASLRQLFSVRHRGSPEGGVVAPHTDGFDVMADVHGKTTRLRDPDEDYVLIQSVQRARTGGENVVLDSYRLVDRLADAVPDLHEFLTRTDVDYFGESVGVRGVPSGYHVRCHIEHTRKGRRIVRMNGGAMPLRRDPGPERIEQMLGLYKKVVEEAAAAAPRVLLTDGEILFLDNYRCMHGRDPYDGDRLVYILTLRTCEAM
jgi:gamma-butyrobetaine dioxygenase